MTMTIRRATPADAERVADIARRNFTETFGHLYPPEDLAYFLDTSYIAETQREALEDPRCAVWLLEDGDEAIGHILVGPCGLPHADVREGDGEIKRLYILQRAHNGGWGAQLMQCAMDWLLRDGRARCGWACGARTSARSGSTVATDSGRSANTCSRSAPPTITNSFSVVLRMRSRAERGPSEART